VKEGFVHQNAAKNIMDAFGMEDVRTNYGQGGYSTWMREQLEEGMLYMNYRGYVGMSGFGTSDINNAYPH